MARRFASSGAAVAIVARRPDVLEQAADRIRADSARPDSVVAVTCDVRRPDEVIAAHGQITERLGPIDILVNNAGTSATSPFADITDEAWQHDLDLKLFAAIRFTRLVLPGMRQRRWGRVINVLNI